MLKDILKEREVPPLVEKAKMLELLLGNEYGYMPPLPDEMSFGEPIKCVRCYCAGRAVLNRVEITSRVGEKSFTFPVYASLPTKPGKYPFFVMINFRDCVPDIYLPAEELIDKVISAGLAAASGRNLQGAIIVAVTNKEIRDRLSACNAGSFKYFPIFSISFFVRKTNASFKFRRFSRPNSYSASV